MRTLFLTFFVVTTSLTFIDAAGPTIFEDGWSPVHASQVVDLPKRSPVQPAVEPVPQVAERRVDAEIEEVSPVDDEEVHEQGNPIDRFEIVRHRAPQKPVVEQQQQTVEEDDVPQEEEQVEVGDNAAGQLEIETQEVEGETAAPPVKHPYRPETEDTPPVIVYPSGVVPTNFAQEDESSADIDENDEYVQTDDQPYRPRLPPQGGRYPPPQQQPGRVPPLPRRPLPPQGQPPANWRRPPPPPLQPGQPIPPEAAFPRNVPDEEVFDGPAPRQQLPRPHPRPENNGGGGGGILGSLTSGLANIGSNIRCGAEDIGVEAKLQDEAFMQRQLDCMLDKGPCDELGANVKRLAPDIMRGICPHPCDECKKGKIQKVMSTIARKYPKQWNEMVREFSRRSQQTRLRN